MLKIVMAAVRKVKSDKTRIRTNASASKPTQGRVRPFKSNSSPVYKTQSDTSLVTGMKNLSLTKRNSYSKQTTRSLHGRGSGHSTVKTITDIADLILENQVKNIVLVAGAGISTASGIPDFRTPGTGLYDNLQQYNLPYGEAIFDIDYFHRNPKPFFALAKEIYPSGKYRPNYVHYFAKLLYEKGLLLRMYTQNIDGLERLAGIPSVKLVEAHGTFSTATCTVCYQKHEGKDVKCSIFQDKLPRCKRKGCPGIVKPDIVFFGEDLPQRFYLYLKDMLQGDLIVVMGTSLEVQPFAGIVDTVRWNVPRVLFNREVVGPFRHGSRSRDIVVKGDIITGIKKFVDMLDWKSEMNQLIFKEEGISPESSACSTVNTDGSDSNKTEAAVSKDSIPNTLHNPESEKDSSEGNRTHDAHPNTQTNIVSESQLDTKKIDNTVFSSRSLVDCNKERQGANGYKTKVPNKTQPRSGSFKPTRELHTVAKPPIVPHRLTQRQQFKNSSLHGYRLNRVGSAETTKVQYRHRLPPPYDARIMCYRNDSSSDSSSGSDDDSSSDFSR